VLSLLEASRAKADIMSEDGNLFRYPSYVQDIMGDIFSLGFGPFRCKIYLLLILNE
jgi:urocanate hydratase